MDSQHSQTTDPKTQEIITRMNRRDHRTEQIIRRILYILEHLIAVLSILALVAALCIEILQRADILTTSAITCTIFSPLWWDWNLCGC